MVVHLSWNICCDWAFLYGCCVLCALAFFAINDTLHGVVMQFVISFGRRWTLFSQLALYVGLMVVRKVTLSV